MAMGYSTDNIEADSMIGGKLRMGFLLKACLDSFYCVLLVLSLALRLRSAWPSPEPLPSPWLCPWPQQHVSVCVQS